ncbi:MAG TPA: ABC transporter permease [Candidatus Saccharimonadales bacterium]|jgi:ABC-type transport system involved in multi-copper enzyme maturation permease subunit
MIPAIRAEFRKLLTVRSTYIFLLICAAITIFYAFYIEGFRQASGVASPEKLASEVVTVAQGISLFVALAGVLLMTHEYRYSTILYSLTSAASRSYVLFAKILVVSVFAIVVTALACSAAPYLTQLGLHMRGLSLTPQDFPFAELLLRSVLFVWGYSMLALIIATIVRSQVGAIAGLFLVPGLGEMLLSLLLKDDAKYLPFSTLGSVLQQNPQSYPNALVVLLAYIAAGWLIAWLLFVRRDAN